MDETEMNVGVAHGAWGEQLAAAYLRHAGYQIRERNVRPCKWDRRLEIDLIVEEPREKVLVFVEVKQHKKHSTYEHRMRSVSAHKLRLLRLACRAWLAKNKWQGAYRFDVIEVFGYPGMKGKAEIDHMTHVRLFANKERFVNWAE